MIEYIAALAPAAVLLVLIYKVDTADKEPWGLIAKVFILGVVCAMIACFLELVVGAALDGIVAAESFVGTLIGVALIEELCKLWAAYTTTWKNPNFNYVFDGVVYCAAAAIGFAAIENVTYVVGAENAMEIAALRAVLSVPGHMCDGILMGIFFGWARYYKAVGNTSKKRTFLVLSVVAPLIEHGVYDFTAGLGTEDSGLFLLLWVLIVYIICFAIVLRSRGAHDVRIPGVYSPKEQAKMQQEAAGGEVQESAPEAGAEGFAAAAAQAPAGQTASAQQPVSAGQTAPVEEAVPQQPAVSEDGNWINPVAQRAMESKDVH